MSRLLLSIDTAGTRCAVALSDLATGDVLAFAEPDIGRGHAEQLMGLVEHLLDAASVRYGDIGKIAVVVGPGSFTGLRVGVAAAKGLALALSVPVVGLSSLEALAEPHWHAGAAVLAVTDAKRGELYAALYAAGGSVLRAPQALAPGGLADWLEGAHGGELVVVGSGARIAADILAHLPVTLANPAGDTDIAAVVRLGGPRGGEGPLKPLYLRGADAKPQAATGILHAPAILP